MPLITDPDQLNQATEITINAATSQITLNLAGNLSADGVEGQALYSFLKEEWLGDANLSKYTFPMQPITSEQYEWGNNGSKFSDWKLATDASRKLVRRAGWREYNVGGSTTREYAGIISLGNIDSGGQVYYQNANAGAATNFTYAGAVNEPVQIFGDSSNGNFDARNFLKLFVREYQKLYGASSLSDIGVSTMTYQAYRFPLSNAADLKVTNVDGTVSSAAPYTGISITYFATDQNRSIGGTNYPFRIIVAGNNATAEQIYEKVQYQLRQNSDIDAGAGTVTGKTADALLRFVGDTLVTGKGVYIDSFNSNDTNRIQFYDQNNVQRTFPFVAAGALVFGANLVADVAAKYWMYFKTLPGANNDYGEANAVIVNDSSGTPITGLISSNSSIGFSFAYDSNVQGGRTAGTPAIVIVKALGLTTAQYVETEYTITRTTGQNVGVVSPLERSYRNP